MPHGQTVHRARNLGPACQHGLIASIEVVANGGCKRGRESVGGHGSVGTSPMDIVDTCLDGTPLVANAVGSAQHSAGDERQERSDERGSDIEKEVHRVPVPSAGPIDARAALMSRAIRSHDT
jgi:hypothetical protein